jgi:L-galactose dehydrogenase
MRYQILGRTSLRLSALGFGAATLGEEYGPVDLATGQRAVDCAIDHGVNFFDVSPYYGRTLAEERLGRYLEGQRHRVVLCTKVGRYDRDPPEGFDFSAARVKRSVEESLRRLRTDVIDLFLAHDIEFAPREVIEGETLPAMRRLKEAGKVRYVGITGFPLGLLRSVAEEAEVDAVLSYCHYSLLHDGLDRVLAPLAEERGIGLVNGSPLHMGVLTHPGPPAWHPAPAPVLAAARAAAVWCRARGVAIEEVALRFALGNAAVASTLVGMSSDAEVLANLRALDGPPDPEVLAGVRAILDPVRDVDWPSGLPENDDPGVEAPEMGPRSGWPALRASPGEIRG